MLLEPLVLSLEVSSKVFNAGIGAAVAGVTALVGAMGLAVKSTFDWAQELDSIGDVMSVTNSEAAALNFTLRKSGTSTEAFNKGVVILSKGLVKADGTLDTVGKSLKDWGVNVLKINGGLKSQTDILGEVSDKYSTFSTQQEKVNFLTEVFGRSGADLIDFFDTLAADGGIDAVTKKVEAFGLAIDPARYEQFNRNIEELKMIGLGLAVSFTEKIMPQLEKFLGWIGDIASSQEFADFKAGFSDFVGAMTSAISQGDWEAAWILIKEKLGQLDQLIADQFDSMDWTSGGAALGRALDSIMNNGVGSVDVPNSLQSLLNGINEFFMASVGADQFGGWKNYFDAWGAQIDAGFRDNQAKIDMYWATLIAVNKATIFALAQNVVIELNNFGFRVGNSTIEFFSNLISSWTSGIQRWGTSVYNQVIGYVNQIIAAFNSIPVIPNVGTLSTAGASGGSSGSVGGRASGGPVIGGQTYNVAEFYKPERFTPSVSGRVDPIDGMDSGQNTTAEISDASMDKLMMRLETALQRIGR